jgi:ABC-type antimicrobial peptide transport system permease subunit
VHAQLARVARPGIDTLIVHSKAQQDFATLALGFSPSVVKILPYQADTEFWRPSPGLQQPNLICTAGLECRDYDTLLAAIAEPVRKLSSVYSKIQTAAQFKKTQEDDINKLLNVLYGLLGLSVIISLFGVVNTLVLSVFERTREIGMLRAVGMTRRQVRRMIRYESIVTALIGGALGIVVGVFLAVLTTQALSDQGIVLTIPWSTIGIFVLATILAGMLAAILPARRAARLNVLKALQYE